MAKDFKGGLGSLLGESPAPSTTEKKTVGRPKSAAENETRATFIVNEGLLEKMKDIAYWDRELIKDIIDKAFSEYIKNYEKKNGAIQPRSKR